VFENKGKKCKVCSKTYKPNDDQDPCIQNLPSVANACCGHGDLKQAYVQFMDGNCVRGEHAITIQKILKEHSELNPNTIKLFRTFRIMDFESDQRKVVD
jgi:hypothetical protein